MEALAAPIAAVLLAAARAVHARLWAFLPLDPPGPRKEQTVPLLVGGHVLNVYLLLFALACHLPWRECTGFGLVLLVGWLDDRRKAAGGLHWSLKALGIALACALPEAGAEFTGTLAARIACAFVLVNAINFLDNTDGVAVAVGALPCLLVLDGRGWPGVLGWSYVGFLVHNWPRARLILGDAGALPLGFVLGRLALAGGGPPGRDVLALAWLPLLDFVQVVGMRLWLGYMPWIGDRRHLTHIARNLGLPRPLVAPLFAALVCTGYWMAD